LSEPRDKFKQKEHLGKSLVDLRPPPAGRVGTEGGDREKEGTGSGQPKYRGLGEDQTIAVQKSIIRAGLQEGLSPAQLWGAKQQG
jgi:hypothetical protein